MPRTAYERVMERTQADGACVRFTGSFKPAGYGQVTVSEGGKRRNAYAHRVVYERHHGPIPEGLIVRHSCDNRWCVNIDHLLIGTYSDNNDDMYQRDRRRRGREGRDACAHGHDLAIYGVWRKPRTSRHDPYLDCKACTNERARRRRVSA